MRILRLPLLGAVILAACGQGSSGPSSASSTDSGTTGDAGPIEAAGPLDAGHDAEGGAMEAGPTPLCLPHFSTGAPSGASSCPPAPASPDTLDALLGGIGLNRCFQLPAWESLFPDGPNDFRLPYFDTLHDTPLWAPHYATRLPRISTRPQARRGRCPSSSRSPRLASGPPSPRAIPVPAWQRPPGTRRRWLTRSSSSSRRPAACPTRRTLESQAASIPAASAAGARADREPSGARALRS